MSKHDVLPYGYTLDNLGSKKKKNALGTPPRAVRGAKQPPSLKTEGIAGGRVLYLTEPIEQTITRLARAP